MKRAILASVVLLMLLGVGVVFADVSWVDGYEGRSGIVAVYDTEDTIACWFYVRDEPEDSWKLCNNNCPYGDGEKSCTCGPLFTRPCPGSGPICRYGRIDCIELVNGEPVIQTATGIIYKE